MQPSAPNHPTQTHAGWHCKQLRETAIVPSGEPGTRNMRKPSAQAGAGGVRRYSLFPKHTLVHYI